MLNVSKCSKNSKRVCLIQQNGTFKIIFNSLLKTKDNTVTDDKIWLSTNK